MQLNARQLWGIIIFVFGSLLYSLNQTIQMLLFANLGSEIIFTLISYFLISLGISLTLFEEFGSQIFIGFISILTTIFVFNGILLIWDSFNAMRYSSTDYFILFQYAINLSEIVDPIALIFVVISPPIGILFWMLISKNDNPTWYYIGIFALILFVETWIFAYTQSIIIF